jgi:hypothetical protein
MNWTKVTGPRPKGHTVYWYTILPDGRRGSVARIYNDDGSFTPGGPWRWTIWQKHERPSRNGTPEARGIASTVGAGKAALMTAYWKGKLQ